MLSCGCGGGGGSVLLPSWCHPLAVLGVFGRGEHGGAGLGAPRVWMLWLCSHAPKCLAILPRFGTTDGCNLLRTQ